MLTRTMFELLRTRHNFADFTKKLENIFIVTIAGTIVSIATKWRDSASEDSNLAMIFYLDKIKM